MKAIYKYPLQIVDQQTLYLPKGAELLSVQEQDRQLMLWAIVDLSAPVEPRLFSVYGTGNSFYSDTMRARYIGTAQIQVIPGVGATNPMMAVWHVFEEPITEEAKLEDPR